MAMMSTKNILPYILFIFSTIFLYFGAVYIHNDIQIHMIMESQTKSTPVPQIYYSVKQGEFNEKLSSKPYKVKKDIFYFHLPSLDKIKNIRLDPDNKENRITLKNFNVIRYHWFSKTLYQLNPEKIHPAHQVDTFELKNNLLTFITTGNDPQLSASFTLDEISQSHLLYLHIFIASLLITSLLFYLFYLYRYAEKNDKLYAKLILYALFLCFTLFKLDYYQSHVRFGYPPDEIKHLAYIKYVHTNHAVVPDFEKMPHYLSHPPLYYEIMNLVYDDTLSTRDNVTQMRLLSSLIFIFGFLGILYLGFSSSLSILGHFVYLSVLTSIPMHSYLGASLTNDTLAGLGGIIFIIGFKRLLEEDYNFFTYFTIMLGIFIAYFSKLTAALLIFFALLFFFIRMVWSKQWISLNKTHYLLIVVFLIPIVYYQLSIIGTYHGLVPTYNLTHPGAYLKSGFYIEEQYRQHLSPYEWFERMLHYIQSGWFGIHSHHSIGHESYKGFLGLLVAHVLAILAIFFPCKEEYKSYCLIGKISILAIFSVQIVQYIFSYKAHLHTGYLGGLQPRYLLPFMFGFAIMASLFVERIKQYFFAAVLIILMCIHALYSDFFYFLLYYH